MATLLLTAAGSAIGSAALPAGVSFLGTTLTGAAIGSAVGGALGSALDQRLFGPGAQMRQGPRLSTLDVVTSTEGAAIPRVFGKMRIAGQIIWATRFTETATTETQSSGGKGGGASTSTTGYSYSVSLAIGLCEGEITGISRLWADGKPMDLTGVEYRLHTGSEDQQPDPLIATLSPDAPAFRSLAYIVFENLPLAPYGNRVPQITVELRRKPSPPPQHRDGPDLPALITGVAMSPGSGEFALATQPVRRVLGEGISASENLNNTLGQPDFLASLDQLEQTCPNCRSVLLVVSWFGTDLRLGQCQLHPGIDRREKQTEPLTWQVSGETRATAHAISTDAEGSAHYGGTPSDISVFQAITELKSRGFEVVFYPFILMDIPPGNPQSQPVFPWRGRIASPDDTTTQATADIASFFGTAAPTDFGAWTGNTIPYAGPAEASQRRMILHYAHLCAAAGGVDAFIIGSELRGITTTRDGAGGYPAVTALRALAADVRAVLPAAQISYAADWSEYANHRPGDGSVAFHLDPLWADPNIDFIAIDNYLPLSDWRPGHAHIDASEADSPYDLGYLDANVEGGEYADWFYSGEGDRASQARSPLRDTAYGEDWVFGVKRLRDWWSNPHQDRPNGIRSVSPTAWVPGSKPIRFTETGCPAVDLGANQPNVFHDPKSSESAFPHFSQGTRDDVMQRRYLQAMLAHWQGDPMIAGIDVWTWDARPYPDFPFRRSIWSDGPNYEKGHWLTGRLDAAPLAELVAEICASSGEARIDVSRLYGLVDGYLLDRPISARDALGPLMLTFGFDAVESDGLIRFVPRGSAPIATLTEADLVAEGESDPFTLNRAQETDLPRAVRLGYIRADAEFRRGSAEASLEPTLSQRIDDTEQAIALTSAKASAATRRWLAEAHTARDSASFALPPSRLALEPADIVALKVDGRDLPFRIATTSDTGARRVEAIRVASETYQPAETIAATPELPAAVFAAPVLMEFLDLPLLRGDENPSAPHIAAFAAPWPGGVTLYRSSEDAAFTESLTLNRPATMGRTVTQLAPSAPSRWSGTSVDIRLSGGGLTSAARLATLKGANTAALKMPSGDWEIIQFQNAELISAQTYRLSGLLRGQAGTEPFIDALPPGTRFVLLNNALMQLPHSENEIGRDFTYRYGPAARPFDDESYRAETRIFAGVGHRPYTPAHLRHSVETNGDIHIQWVRRARRGGDGWDIPPPLAEESERYRVRIFAGTALLREAETTVPAFLYKSVQQATDAAPHPLRVEIAQISAVTGPGPIASHLIDP